MAYPASEYQHAFLSHRQPLLVLLEKIPNQHGEFRIYPEGLSIRAQVDQLFGFDAAVLGALTGVEPPVTASPDLQSATARLQQSTTPIAQALVQLPAEMLDSPLEIEGQTRKVYQWLDFVREHEIHHKGQLWMAARMLGIESPYYVNEEL
jgi:hypothetical protein